MKRLFALILSVCMLMGAVVYTAVPTGAATYGYILGDADDNGKVDMKDVMMIRRYLTSLESAKNISLLAADVNKDGAVNLQDVLELRKSFVSLTELDENNTDKAYKVDSISIGEKNISRFTIVIPDTDDVAMKYAAERLKAYINMACGINLNITDDESSVEGYMIKYQYDTDDLYELGLEGYRVAIEEDGNLTFTCGSMRGPLYVTFFFLEEVVGWRFLTDPNDWVVTYLYEAENINLPVGYEEIEVPVFTYRAASQKGITSENFKMLRINAVDGGAHVNAQCGWGVGTLFIHAHSYEYQCGISASEQPCLTSDETFQQIVDYNTNLIDTRQAGGQLLGQSWTQISCSPNDNTNFCTCTACKAVYAAERSIAGTVFRMANRVSEAMSERYPGIEIYTIAYWDARKPPQMTRPLDNINVCYCIGGCNNHTYDHPEDCVEAGGNPRLQYTNWEGTSDGNSSNAEDLKYYEQWMELTNNVTIWYYSPNYAFYMSPAANLFNIYNDFKYIAESGATGIYSEGCYGDKDNPPPTSSYEMLRGYMVSKMLWDPYMSEEEYNDLFNEYLMIYYGDGWEYMRKAIELEDYASDLNGCWTNNFDRPWNVYNEEYIAENYLVIRELYDKAYDAAKTADQKRRVARCRTHIDFLGLSATYERDYVNGDAATKAAYAERYEFLYNTVLDKNVPGAKGDVIRLYCAGEGTAGCNNFPKSASDIYNPMEWLLEGFSGYWEWDGSRWV